MTFNTSDFPEHALKDYEVTAVHPDDFLLDQLDLYPGVTLGVLHQQVAAYRHEPTTFARPAGQARAIGRASVRRRATPAPPVVRLQLDLTVSITTAMLTVPGHVANGGHHGQHGLAEEALFARWATDHGHLHSGRP